MFITKKELNNILGRLEKVERKVKQDSYLYWTYYDKYENYLSSIELKECINLILDYLDIELIRTKAIPENTIIRKIKKQKTGKVK